mmetsp:Transcript_4889/g.31309  ORF Transcript_4889/g.31309 Transcript_4889/m.31309 type:complete len:290 (+) Transcript_4889:1688-2557(+)
MNSEKIKITPVAFVEEQFVPNLCHHHVPRIGRTRCAHETRQDLICCVDISFFLLLEPFDYRILACGHVGKHDVFELLKLPRELWCHAIVGLVIALKFTAAHEIHRLWLRHIEFAECCKLDLLEHPPLGSHFHRGSLRGLSSISIPPSESLEVATTCPRRSVFGVVGHSFTFRSNVSPWIAISSLEPLLEPSGRSKSWSGDGFVVDKLVGIFSVLVAEVEHRCGGCVSIGLVPSCRVRRRSKTTRQPRPPRVPISSRLVSFSSSSTTHRSVLFHRLHQRSRRLCRSCPLC